MNDELKYLLLNKSYHHLLQGYLGLYLNSKDTQTTITNFDIALDMKLNALGNSETYSRYSISDNLNEIIKNLAGLDERFLKKSLKLIHKFKILRNKAVHYGFIYPSLISKVLIRRLLDFLLYEIVKCYLDEDLIKILERLFNKRYELNRESVNMQESTYTKLLNAGFIIEFKTTVDNDLTDDMLEFFKILDDNQKFENEALNLRKQIRFSPLIYLCAPNIRFRFNEFSRYVKVFWGRYSRFKVRIKLISQYSPEKPSEYIESLIEYTHNLLKDSQLNRSNMSLDLIYRGISKEIAQIILRYTELYRRNYISINNLMKLLDILIEEIPAKTKEAILLYRKFFKIGDYQTHATLASMMSESSLTHLMIIIKKAFPKIWQYFKDKMGRSIVMHRNQINEIPLILK